MKEAQLQDCSTWQSLRCQQSLSAACVNAWSAGRCFTIRTRLQSCMGAVLELGRLPTSSCLHALVQIEPHVCPRKGWVYVGNGRPRPQDIMQDMGPKWPSGRPYTRPYDLHLLCIDQPQDFVRVCSGLQWPDVAPGNILAWLVQGGTETDVAGPAPSNASIPAAVVSQAAPAAATPAAAVPGAPHTTYSAMLVQRHNAI